MGCSASCKIFEAVSSAVEWIAESKLGLKITHILDDFFLVESTEERAKQDLQTFLAMCQEIGIPMAPDKTFGPDQIMSFVGYEIDSLIQEVRLPQDKLEKCREQILSMLGKEKTTLKELQSVLGVLNFACGVVLPGRPFLRRLYDLTIGIRKPFFKIRLTRRAKQDLEVWLKFLEENNGRWLIPKHKLITEPGLDFFTDSSKTIGFGAVFGNKWFSGVWSEWWTEQNITFLELYPIVLAFEVWGSLVSHKEVTVHTDNQALVSVLNKQTSKEPLVMALVRRLVLNCLKHDIVVKTVHIEGAINIAADALSRLQMGRFWDHNPEFNKEPTPTPPLPTRINP